MGDFQVLIYYGINYLCVGLEDNAVLVWPNRVRYPFRLNQQRILSHYR
jgi:hypothetical protein